LPPKPAPDLQIKPDVFSAANSDSATLPPSPRQVQTGAFGDPNGVPAQPAPNTVSLTVARLGAFDLPSGAVRGNGTAVSPGSSGTTHSAGFRETTSSTHSVAQETRNVQTGGFGSAVPGATTAPAQPIQENPVLQPVEILYKPRPAYTAEAREQKVEGEVLLDVVFTAAGSLRVNRVVKGLGYGLDDMALAAAQRIQFHPAKREGKAYDYGALVRIVFALSD